MAKLILSFKGHHLSIHHLDERPATIGRDGNCGICIDSLAIAPRHAELVPSDGGYLLLTLDPDYPVLLNSEQMDQARLHHGDLIQVGKHTLTFSEDTLEIAPPQSPNEPESEGPEEEVEGEIATGFVPAYIQIQSGSRIGKVIVFRRAVTRLKRAGAEGVVVSRKGDTYHMLRLDGKADIGINSAPIADGEAEVELSNGDLVQVDELRFQFFTGEIGEPPGDASES